MNIQKPTIVLFDMDGTTVRHINPALLHILERLDDWSYKMSSLFSKLTRQKVQHTHLVEFRDGKRPKVLVHRALHKVRRKSVEQIVEPCPGIYGILDFLKGQDVRMGLVSNGLGKGYGHDILEKFDLAQYFEVTIFREDIKKSKPHPEPLLRALHALDTPPTKDDVVWYIGDRRKDIQAATAARNHLPCPVQAFGYGLHAMVGTLKAAQEQKNPPAFLVSWQDLEPQLEDLFEKKSGNSHLGSNAKAA